MTSKVKLFLLINFFVVGALSAQQSLKIYPGKSKVSFKIKNSGFNVDGTMTGINGTIVFDPKSPETGSFNVTVDVSTINTGINGRDNHLKKEEYFNAAKFPTIKFVSKEIKAVPGGYEVKGTLTMKGVSKEISFKFTHTEYQSTSAFEGGFDINRRDYGVGGSSLMMSDTAVVSIYVLVTK